MTWPRHQRSASRSTEPRQWFRDHHLPAGDQPHHRSARPQKAQSNSKLIVIAGVVASLFLFWYLHLLTLNQMTQLSGGLAMPDSLVGGFSPDYIAQLQRRDGRVRPRPAQLRPQDRRHLVPADFRLQLAAADRHQRGAEVAGAGPCGPLPCSSRWPHLWSNVAIDSMLAAEAPDAGAVALASGRHRCFLGTFPG